MTRRVPFAFNPKGMPPPVAFGEYLIRITIDVDERGLMKTSINKPLPAVQVLGLLLDSMQGQFQVMQQQAAMIIDPNKNNNELQARSAIANDGLEKDGGEEKENDNDR